MLVDIYFALRGWGIRQAFEHLQRIRSTLRGPAQVRQEVRKPTTNLTTTLLTRARSVNLSLLLSACLFLLRRSAGLFPLQRMTAVLRRREIWGGLMFLSPGSSLLHVFGFVAREPLSLHWRTGVEAAVPQVGEHDDDHPYEGDELEHGERDRACTGRHVGETCDGMFRAKLLVRSRSWVDVTSVDSDPAIFRVGVGFESGEWNSKRSSRGSRDTARLLDNGDAAAEVYAAGFGELTCLRLAMIVAAGPRVQAISVLRVDFLRPAGPDLGSKIALAKVQYDQAPCVRLVCLLGFWCGSGSPWS